MIDELVKSKYDSDPVKTWKIKIDKEAALVSFSLIIYPNQFLYKIVLNFATAA